MIVSATVDLYSKNTQMNQGHRTLVPFPNAKQTMKHVNIFQDQSCCKKSALKDAEF